MKIVIYSDEYRGQLDEILRRFSCEIYDGLHDLDRFIEGHWAIYLAVKNHTVIGFSSFNIIDYYGFKCSILSNDYVYVLPEYRTSKAMYLLSIQAGKICTEHNMPLEHYYASEHAKKLSRKLKGKKMFETYLYPIDEVKLEYDRLRKFVKIKE